MTATDIRQGTGIASVNKGDKIRVFWQSQEGDIEESSYDGGWKYATSNNLPAYFAKPGTPIAASTEDLDMINLYYLDYSNSVLSRYYNAISNSWHGGYSIDTAAPYTKLGATYLAGASEHHLFYQLPDNTIQEKIYSNGSGWTTGGNLGAALPGTSIGVSSWAGSGGINEMRIFVQGNNKDIVQKCWTTGKGWWHMDYVVESAAPSGCAITALEFGSGPTDVHLRVYWTGHNTDFWQWCWDNGPDKYKKAAMQGKTIQGTDLAAIWWPGTNLRVYYQAGKQSFAITEWMYNPSKPSAVGNTGQDPLPPA